MINEWLLWNFSNYCSSVTGYSLTGEKKDWLLNLAWIGFLCVTLLINVCSFDPLLLKSLVLLEKKQLLGPVLVSEQRIKQRQLNAQINNNSMQTYLCEFAWSWCPVLWPFLKILKSKLLIQDLIDISTNRQPKWDIYTSKSTFRCWQPETNQILITEVVAIVSYLAKHLAVFWLTRYV